MTRLQESRVVPVTGRMYRYRKGARPPVRQWRAVCGCGWRDHELRVRMEAGQALARHQLATGCQREGKSERAS